MHPYSHYSGEAVGTFSHSVPIGTSGQYALQPCRTVRRQSPTSIPKQCSEVQGKFESEKLKAVAEGGDEDDEDDYEKMQSFVTNEEEIKAWRMSLISQPTNYGMFTPPPRHGSRPHSSQISATQSQYERQLRPSSYVPGSQRTSQLGAHHREHGAGVGYGSLQQTSGVATNIQAMNSPRIQRGEQNVDSDNSSGNSPLTLNSSRLVSNRRSASPQILDKPTMMQDVTSLPTPPQRQFHGMSGSPASRSPNMASSRPSGPALKRDICTSQGSSDNELDSGRSVTELRDGKDSGNISLVKARLQQLEKPATSTKPILLQKPNRPGW